MTAPGRITQAYSDGSDWSTVLVGVTEKPSSLLYGFRSLARTSMPSPNHTVRAEVRQVISCREKSG